MRAVAILSAVATLWGGCALPQAQNAALPDAPPVAMSLVAATPAKSPVMINGRPYVKPTGRVLFRDYLHTTYGLPGLGGTTVRALYGEARGKPEGWGQDAAGFGQRFGSSAAVTAINGTVRLGMESAFHEDLRYIPCHGCRWKQKVENALLAEITARHNADGRRFFTLTPTISDFSGPIITHTLWYPGASRGPEQGVVSARVVFATRIGFHLFREFIWERRHEGAHGEMGTIRPNAP